MNETHDVICININEKKSKKNEKIPLILNEPFITKIKTKVSPPAPSQSKSVSTHAADAAVLSEVNLKLAHTASDSIAALDVKIAELTSKLKTLSVRNINQKNVDETYSLKKRPSKRVC